MGRGGPHQSLVGVNFTPRKGAGELRDGFRDPDLVLWLFICSL